MKNAKILFILLFISSISFSQIKLGMMIGKSQSNKQTSNSVLGEKLDFNIIKIEQTKSGSINIYTKEQDCKKIQSELDNKLKNKLDDLTIIRVYVLNNNYSPKTCITLKTDYNELDIDSITLNDNNENIQ